MKNFLLVVPRFSKKGEFYSFPFGLAYTSSYLKSKGFMVHCLNLCHYEEIIPTIEILKESIIKNNINVVWTGGMSGHWNLIDDVLNNTKKINSDIITAVGGPLITSDPILAMENMKIDYGVIGEGEITAGELAFALSENTDVAGVNGIIYRKNDSLVQTQERLPILDLDSLPFPDYEGFGYREWMTTMKYSGQHPILENYDIVRYSPIIGSRSCPFSCTFCYHPLGKKYRQRSLDNILKEIDFLVKTYSINFISFLDELFSLNAERMYELADRIKKYNIHWEACFRVNNVTSELLNKLKKSNLHYMGFGVESMSDKILKSMKKMITKAEIENAFELARKAGIFCAGNIILGDPGETIETINESMDWWKKNRHYTISLSFIKAIPDSAVYQYAIKNNIIKNKLEHNKNNFPIVNLTKIPNKQFNKIKKKVSSYRFNLKYVTDGELLDSVKLDEKHKGNNFYNITIKCPFCNQIHEYKRFLKSMNKYLTVFCKNCYSCFKIKQEKAFYDEFSPWKMFSDIYFAKFYSYLLKKNIIKPDNKILILIKKFTKKILKRI